MRKRVRISSGKTTKHKLIGGPYAGQTLVNHSLNGATLVFEAKGMIGQYLSNGCWLSQDNNINK